MTGYPSTRPGHNAAIVLDRSFYQRPTDVVARDLLGKLLRHETMEGQVTVRIDEVEAYLGPSDPACHTAGGRRTPRVRSMWGEAGHAYVYLIYGVHHCLNVVTIGNAAGEAVLIRGGAIVSGGDLVRRRRGPHVAPRDLVNGPGKLCQALAIDRGHDGLDLCDRASALCLYDDGVLVSDGEVRRTRRIGVASAGEAAEWPLRFVVEPDR